MNKKSRKKILNISLLCMKFANNCKYCPRNGKCEDELKKEKKYGKVNNNIK